VPISAGFTLCILVRVKWPSSIFFARRVSTSTTAAPAVAAGATHGRDLCNACITGRTGRTHTVQIGSRPSWLACCVGGAAASHRRSPRR